MYKEAIEIEKCPEYYNRKMDEIAWKISKTWLPRLYTGKKEDRKPKKTT